MERDIYGHKLGGNLGLLRRKLQKLIFAENESSMKMYNTRCRSMEITSFAGEGGIDAPWWELRFPTGVVEITIMEILSPNVLQCTVSAMSADTHKCGILQ